MWRDETLTLPSGRQQVVHRAGSGAPLLWLHSLYGFESDDPVATSLAERHEVIAPATPGTTDLAELDDIDTVAELALHYDDLLETLGVGPLPVVGHSFGAMIGAELAAHFPARVSSLALLSPLGLWDDDEPVTDVFAVPYTEVADVLFADPSRAALRSQETESGERDVEAVVALAQAMTTVAKFLWPIPDRGLGRRLYRVRMPSLVVFGDKDRFVPAAYGPRFAALLPQGRSEIVSDAGHMIQREQPDAVVALLHALIPV